MEKIKRYLIDSDILIDFLRGLIETNLEERVISN